MPSSSEVNYTVRKTGEPCTKDFRVYITAGDDIVSPWHEIPLFPSENEPQVVNMVMEIPRWSNVKMEITKDEFLTPIRQDIHNDKLRYVPNIFPHKGYPWNYGSLPQTWEDPNIADPHVGLRGDSDPLDVCELAGEIGPVGAIKRVKVLGTFAVIDEGETDWKVVAVDATNPLAGRLNDISDVETHMPGYLETMQEWFRLYKVPEGKGENEIAMNGELKGKDFALSLIARCHGSWKKILIEPTMKTKVSMADIGIEDKNLAKQLMEGCRSDDLQLIDPLDVEKYHFLNSDWPLAASCPGRTIDV
ncbi:uncharacterized protein PFLUO_LOCUS6621 [Penicillium psychrofluorescens]|uniref:uncharacterized protein n=1 Tax=Penicillium psychrofluorescens TaxID=3158075 RepID=UPI003CCCEDEA